MSQTPGAGGFHQHQQRFVYNDGCHNIQFHQQTVAFGNGGQQTPTAATVQMPSLQSPVMSGTLPASNLFQQAADLHNQAHAQAMQQHARFLPQRSAASVQQALPAMPQQAQIGFMPSQATTPQAQYQYPQQYQQPQSQTLQLRRVTAPAQGCLEEINSSDSEEDEDTDSEDERQEAEAARREEEYRRQKEESEKQRKEFEARQAATEKTMQAMQRTMAEQQRLNQERETTQQRQREQYEAQRQYDEQVRRVSEQVAKQARDQELAEQRAAHEEERRRWQMQQAQEREIRHAKELRRQEKDEAKAREQEAKEAAKLEKQRLKEEREAARREQERVQVAEHLRLQREKQEQEMAAMRQQLEYERSQKYEIEQNHSRELAALAAQSASRPQTESAELQKLIVELRAHSLKDQDVAKLVEETMSKQLQGVARSHDLESSVARLQKSLGKLPSPASAADVQSAVSRGIEDVMQKAAAKYGKIPERQAIEEGRVQQTPMPWQEQQMPVRQSEQSRRVELKQQEVHSSKTSKREAKALPTPMSYASSSKSMDVLPSSGQHAPARPESAQPIPAEENHFLAKVKHSAEPLHRSSRNLAGSAVSAKPVEDSASFRSKKSSKDPTKASQGKSSKPPKQSMSAPHAESLSPRPDAGSSKARTSDHAMTKAKSSDVAATASQRPTDKASKQLSAPPSSSHHDVAPSAKRSDGNALTRIKQGKEVPAAHSVKSTDNKALARVRSTKNSSAEPSVPLTTGVLATFSQLQAGSFSSNVEAPESARAVEENVVVRSKPQAPGSVKQSEGDALMRSKHEDAESVKPREENVLVRHKRKEKDARKEKK